MRGRQGAWWNEAPDPQLCMIVDCIGHGNRCFLVVGIWCKRWRTGVDWHMQCHVGKLYMSTVLKSGYIMVWVCL